MMIHLNKFLRLCLRTRTMSDFNIEFENFINYMLNDVIEVLTKKV